MGAESSAPVFLCLTQNNGLYSFHKLHNGCSGNERHAFTVYNCQTLGAAVTVQHNLHSGEGFIIQVQSKPDLFLFGGLLISEAVGGKSAKGIFKVCQIQCFRFYDGFGFSSFLGSFRCFLRSFCQHLFCLIIPDPFFIVIHLRNQSMLGVFQCNVNLGHICKVSPEDLLMPQVIIGSIGQNAVIHTVQIIDDLRIANADTDLAVSGSETIISILKSYEGMEATNLMISDGRMEITASDDGLNAAGGNDASGMGNRPGMGGFSSSTGRIVISGGTVTLYASGDGLDANGTLSITGGNVTVVGPINGDTAILDFNTTGTITGGTFIGVGSANMAQNFSSSSSQGAMLVKTGTQSEGTTIRLADSSGKELLSYTAQQSFSCVILSHPSIVQGNTYTLTVGSSGTTVTMSSTVYGSSGNGGGMDRGMGGKNMGGMDDHQGGGQMPDMGGNHSGNGMGGRNGGMGRNP